MQSVRFRFSSPTAVASIAAAALLAAPFALPRAARAKPGFAATVRTILTADYARFTQAFQKKDVAGIDTQMTVNYVALGTDGKPTTRAQVLADFKGQMATLQNVTWKRTIRRMNVFGKTADVIVDGDLVGTSRGKDGKPHKMERLATSNDTWIEITPTLWKLSRSRVLKVKTTVDGKETAAH